MYPHYLLVRPAASIAYAEKTCCFPRQILGLGGNLWIRVDVNTTICLAAGGLAVMMVGPLGPPKI